MRCTGNIEVRWVDENYINLDPIQVGGRLTPEAMKAVIAYGDGYSVCDNCRKPFRLDAIQSPPIDSFHRDLAVFLNMDVARVVPGARRGFQAVARTYVKPGDPVLITALSHYTEVLAIEEAGGIPLEVPAGAGNRITGDAVAERIEDVTREFSRSPSLAFIDHVDYQFGNLHDITGAVRAARQYDVPVLINGAYTVGILPVDGKAIGADFIVGSGHKSMAAPAPSGVLATTMERAAEVFRTTSARTDLTGRTFGVKEVSMMGCTLMGVTLMGMMASFPRVRERVTRWEEHLRNSVLVLDALASIEGTKILSEMPRRHTLTRVDTTGSFDRVAKGHKKKGFFLSSALKEKGITGLIPGATRVWKYNTYGMTHSQAEHTAEAFRSIATENGIPLMNRV